MPGTNPVLLRLLRPDLFWAAESVGKIVMLNVSSSENIDRKNENSAEAGDNHTVQPESGNHVRRVRELVGYDAVLIPVVKGKKEPVESGWQQTTISRMSEPGYVEELEEYNIGVVLGAASCGLCAVDIDTDDQVEPFLTLNPALRQTLRTRGSRGAQIWVKVKGEYPKLTKLKSKEGKEWGEWRADGGQSVISGEHPCGRDYQILNEANPLEIAFADIVWPDDLKLPWVKSDFDLVVEAEGQPFTVSDKGSIVLNQMFFVKKYTLEHHVLFDSGLGEFFQYDPADGLWKKHSVETIKRAFLETLTTAAIETGVTSLFLKRTDGCVAGLVALLRATVEKKDVFSNRPAAIHVANGMICFEDDEVTLKSFHPSYLSRNQCPFVFDPNADCPNFKKELLETALEADDILLMQKWAGAVMLGTNAAQRFLLMLGTAGGGKSTVMSVLERTIGLQNVSQLRTRHLDDRFELFSFVGKTLLTGKDVASDFLMQEGAHVLKALVGGDLMEAEKKGFNERVHLRGDFNVGITCNADLNIRLQGDAGAWRRRLLVIKYERPAPKKKNVRFADELLEEEGQGILRWIV